MTFTTSVENLFAFRRGCHTNNQLRAEALLVEQPLGRQRAREARTARQRAFGAAHGPTHRQRRGAPISRRRSTRPRVDKAAHAIEGEAPEHPTHRRQAEQRATRRRPLGGIEREEATQSAQGRSPAARARSAFRRAREDPTSHVRRRRCTRS